MTPEERARRTAYMREYRRRHPDFCDRERERNRAAVRALWRLAALHAEEYERLCDQERLSVGLPPLRTVPVGRPPAQSDGGSANA